MQFTIHLRQVDDQGILMSDETIVILDKGIDQLAEIGLSLDEGIVSGKWFESPALAF